MINSARSFLSPREDGTVHESILSNFPRSATLRDVNSDPPDLDSLSINLADRTFKDTYYLHYNRWMNILRVHSSIDSRMAVLRREVRILFNTYSTFSRYVSLLFVHLSNVIHNMKTFWKSRIQWTSPIKLWTARIFQQIWSRTWRSIPEKIIEKFGETTK